MQTNNKLRKALETLVDVVDAWKDHLPPVIRDGELAKAIKKAEAALAEPVKNNEVGTVEKQAARHHAWCRRYGINGDNKVDCAHPDMSCDLCTLRWAQLPYVEKEGGAK